MRTGIGRCHLTGPALAIVTTLATLAFTGCRGSQNDLENPGPTVVRPAPEGPPRSVTLGFSSMPAEQTVDSYINAFATAARYGELLLVSRVPPWQEFFPNQHPSQDTNSTTRLETALLDQYDGLRLVYAIDPTDPVVERDRVANLPASVDATEGFANANLRNAFVAYALYIVRNYEPEYLALGVEINMLRSRNADQFEHFVSLYNEAYDSVKEARPATKVFPTFQLEDLEGNLGDAHPPEWGVLDAFRGRIDVLAVSTYPYLADIRTAGDLRPDYYSQLGDHFDGEIIIIESGYASAPVAAERLVGTEADQDVYLQRLLNDAQAFGFSGVIWRAALDPQYAGAGAISVFRDIGLRKGDGSNKAAWTTWEIWALRPLVE
jgi:hypothetical protein